MSTCVTTGCRRSVYIVKRQLCRRCYGRAQARGFDSLAERHEISGEQWDNRRADCSVCGTAVPATVRLVDYGTGRKMVCVEGTRAARRRMLYGIDIGDVAAMLEQQDGKCAVCDLTLQLRSPVRGPQLDTACLDHDHVCCPGKRTCGRCIRGLLCVSCNVKVGYWERGQGQITERGVEYLARPPIEIPVFSPD